MGTEDQRDEGWQFYYVPADWVADITRAVTLSITRAVAIAVALFVIVAVLALGLWLAYVYLPATAFRILALVLLADVALGIAVRFLVARRRQQPDAK